jgi:hypothetical protein
MNTATKRRAARAVAIALPLAAVAGDAAADAVTDWNVRANDIVIEAKLGTPPAIRVMAYVQTAVHQAVGDGARGANLDAAIAAANRAVLTRLLPAQQASIDKAYEAALAAVADGAGKAAGIAAGERAAAAVFARRASDVPSAESYRPHASAGTYVPTAAVAAPTWSSRTPWVMTSASQFRVAAPPALASDSWARDYNEVKELGQRASTKRTAEQTEVARFWEYSLPAIYHGAVRAVAVQPGRDLARNARLFAAVAQAMDDGMVAVFDSKYHHNFWRPATAIRNGDIDGNDATARDAAWASLIEAPLHPEYPSAHATLAGAVGAVLEAEIGKGPAPALATSSPTAKGATRRWASVDEFAREVAESRIYAGIHYRFSTDAGLALGRRIGELAVGRVIASH